MANSNVFDKVLVERTGFVTCYVTPVHKFKSSLLDEVLDLGPDLFWLLSPPKFKEVYLSMVELSSLILEQSFYYICEDRWNRISVVVLGSQEPACVLVRVRYQVNSCYRFFIIWNWGLRFVITWAQILLEVSLKLSANHWSLSKEDQAF
jgi:hypothetical protein